MQITRLSKNVLYKELVCWLGFILFALVYNMVTGPPASKFIYVFISTANFALSYYLLFLVVFPNFFEEKKILFILSYIIVIVIYISIDYFHLKKILPFFGGHYPRGGADLYNFIKGAFILFSFVAITSLGSYLNWRSIERLKERSKKEKSIISRELNFIKNQFNSHLTFNFFNFCYSKTLRLSEKAAESIETFSEMLRYSLNNGLDEHVLLKKEIDYIEHFISVQKCLTAKVFIKLQYEGNISNYYILPRILATFIENAFKHGIFSEEESPIIIFLAIENDTLSFIVKNKKANKKIFVSTGIGLQNVKQVLELFYQSKHDLKIEQTENTYCSKLTLKLTPVL
jgi:two-component system LytT family sensor kinase